MKPYAIIEKSVGETPLQALEQHRNDAKLPKNTPLAYAGRLDPMASGQLLVLIGEECKRQSAYHALDKAYQFAVLLGTRSDTGDVLGLLEWDTPDLSVSKTDLTKISKTLTGPLSLPYPRFSSKTVNGKPLHVWTLENRLDEIEIPIAHTHIYSLKLTETALLNAAEVYETALQKIDSLPPVTEVSKALGADFRRADVRLSWQTWLEYHQGKTLTLATFNCVCSSGTYMRSLAEEIGRQLNTAALAFSIHRTEIGRYQKLPLGWGFWRNKY